MINTVMMQWMGQPFFDDLRTDQQLGYVVWGRQKKIRDVMGNYFLVQSDKRSAEYLVKAMNDHFILKRTALKSMTDEEFDV